MYIVETNPAIPPIITINHNPILMPLHTPSPPNSDSHRGSFFSTQFIYTAYDATHSSNDHHSNKNYFFYHILIPMPFT